MKKMLTILGPTATGKTALAAQLAHECGGEIISADSRQVYRGMDIGTGKDLDDYTVAGQQVTYHLIDIAEPGSKYNLFQYQRDFHTVYNDIRDRGALPILCGGTGLYIEAVLKGYALSPVPQNPALRQSLEGKTLEELTKTLKALKNRTGSVMHNTTDVDSCQRAIRAIEIETYNLQHPTALRPMPPVPAVVVGMAIDRDERRQRITQRLKDRLEHGMVNEIKMLLEQGVTETDLTYYGLEYKYVTEYATGKLSYEDMFQQLNTAIHQFAKRQMTWFRGMERRGTHINWVDATLPMKEKVRQVKQIYERG